MKIAITGKGGVGKTTISGLLCKTFSNMGKRVVAVDADPDANLWSAIGLSEEEAKKLEPITSMKSLIEERTGVPQGSTGSVYKLNPKVDDIPEIAGVKFENIRLITIGKSKDGGSGCYCPENSLLKTLISHLVIGCDDVVIIDTEAGIEHISRGVAQGVDFFIIVVEPGQKSIQTAHTIKDMASSIGVKEVTYIANKVGSNSDLEIIKKNMQGIRMLGQISFDKKIINSDLQGISPAENNQDLLNIIEDIAKNLTAEKAAGN